MSVGGPGASRLLTGSSGYLGAYHSGGSTSPHLAGSAFQLIGNSSSALATATGGRASVPGQSIPSPDVVMLTRMLQDKENMVSLPRFQSLILRVVVMLTYTRIETAVRIIAVFVLG